MYEDILLPSVSHQAGPRYVSLAEINGVYDFFNTDNGGFLVREYVISDYLI